MRILAGPVDLDIMVRMLDPRAAQATLTQRRYQPGQQGRLAGGGDESQYRHTIQFGHVWHPQGTGEQA